MDFENDLTLGIQKVLTSSVRMVWSLIIYPTLFCILYFLNVVVFSGSGWNGLGAILLSILFALIVAGIFLVLTTIKTVKYFRILSSFEQENIRINSTAFALNEKNIKKSRNLLNIFVSGTLVIMLLFICLCILPPIIGNL